MPLSLADVARSASLRLTSALGPVPLAILLALMAVTAAAWALTLYQAMSMGVPVGAAMSGGMSMENMQGMESMQGMEGMAGMTGMAMGGVSAANWSLASLATFVMLWTLMMIAMMLPAAMPMILIFAAAQSRRDRHVAIPTWIFVTGYILVWAAAGVLAYVLDQGVSGLMRAPSSLERGTWAPLVLGTTLAVAGLYQFTPLKRVCLRHCRSPLAFVAQYWRDGRRGALGMGIRHGLYCLGCCWALFAVLTTVGMMSIAWMLLLTLLVFAEMVFPHGARTSAAVGLGLVLLGLLVASGALQSSWIA
jgi:predicted metal-binding membrane protein